MVYGNCEGEDFFSKVWFDTLLSLLFYSGLRISEALSLCIADLNFEKLEMVINQAKGHRRFYKGLGPKLLEVLKFYLKHRPQTNHDYLFVLPCGKRVTVKTATRRLHRHSKRTGIPATFHAFRANYITRQLEAGHALIDVSIAVNHKDLRSTEGYVHANKARSIEAQKGWE